MKKISPFNSSLNLLCVTIKDLRASAYITVNHHKHKTLKHSTTVYCLVKYLQIDIHNITHASKEQKKVRHIILARNLDRLLLTAIIFTKLK